jgi:GNAT superfamily N-acetyltransferase
MRRPATRPDPEPGLSSSARGPSPEPGLTIVRARSPSDLATVRALFDAYAAGLAIDLSFQGFDEELASLPGRYADPGGCLLLATLGGQALGCVGVRPLEAGAAELKRLYVDPAARGRGAGAALVRAAIDWVEASGYEWLRLDTLESMEEARRLYRSLGFTECPPYGNHPVPGTIFLERRCRRTSGP